MKEETGGAVSIGWREEQKSMGGRVVEWERAVIAGKAGHIMAGMSGRKRTQIQRKPNLTDAVICGMTCLIPIHSYLSPYSAVF